MNFKMFAKENFESLGLDSIGARRLSDSLEEEVQKQIHHDILKTFLKVVKELNSLGHNLQPEIVSPGEITFRDQIDGEKCKLRLAIDSIISAGYGHVIETQREIDLIDLWLANEKVDGVNFSINDSIKVVAGNLKGKEGAIISLISMLPKVIYLVEDGTGKDFKVLQEEIEIQNEEKF